MTVSDSSNQVRQLVVDDGDAGQRIDNFLTRELKGVPRSHIYRILRRGEVRVNGGRIKAAHRLEPGDRVRVPPRRVAEQTEQAVQPGRHIQAQLENAMLYEDERLLAIDKPSGLAVHGGSGLAYGVIEALRSMRPDARELELVHRLDRDTSGVLLVAKRRSALRQLHGMLREGQMDKIYTALLAGRWRHDRESVRVPLRKSVMRGGERIVTVDAAGKPARTDFKVVKRFSDTLLVEARLHTGRTHQIRVHARYLGTPVAGDGKYGDEQANRMLASLGLKRLFLHASAIAFPWGEQGQKLRIEAPLAKELQEVLDRLESRICE